MRRPPVGKPQVYVKLIDGRPRYTTFVLHGDGSCGFALATEGPPSGRMRLGRGFILRAKFRPRPDAWRAALGRLAALGFVPLAEARRRGWVPEGWRVAVRPGCGWVRRWNRGN